MKKDTPITNASLPNVHSLRMTSEELEIELQESQRITKALRDLIKETIFWTANNPIYNRQGYSCFITQDTAIRDINYRDVKLYETADEAIDAALKEMLIDQENAL